MSKSFKTLLSIIVLLFIALMIIVSSGAQIYTDWLWFDNLGFLRTYLIMFFSNFGLRIIIGGIFTLFIFLNLLVTRSYLLNYINLDRGDNVENIFGQEENSFLEWLNKKRLTLIYLALSLVLGFLFSSISSDLWKIVLKYLNQTSFGEIDPIFGKDIGFYVFSLPFYNFIKEMSMVLIILSLIVTGVIYIFTSGISSFGEVGGKLSAKAKSHITLLIMAFLFLKAWDYRLSMFDLLYSPRGVAFGASYTDINANLVGLKILFVIALVIGVLLIVTLFNKNYKLLVWGLGAWLLTSLIFGSIYPAFVQRFQVEPNEIAREQRYINYNIDMTLKAYGLNDLETSEFRVENELSASDLEENQATIDNIRLWDSRPLLSTYSQLQELRQYYNFNDVDIDRYKIDGDYRQVMLSAREMDQNLLSSQAQTWINQTLKYTHGYGLVMSPVNTMTDQGLPEFFIKDIPPQTETDLEVDNSAVYYGEKTNNYVIANSKSREFHYPSGSENIYTTYDGSGGVKISNFFRKSLYALRFNNIKFLLADDITPDSQIMYYRNIKQRVRKAAPFLEYDQDPYLVLADGRLFWIQDAYTTTERYPYSQPYHNRNNYIRNSIKIVIDAYNGSMDFYVIDKEDPLALTYQKIFPDLFIDGEEMPEVFREHLRYPEDLFRIQTEVYGTYHMTDPQVFYNKEDMWNIPNENYAGSSSQMKPYYIITRLPGNDSEEFLLMQPFTPATKNNMIAWMAARSDGENYGELLVYNFPKDTLVYGPTQIESRIDQESRISQSLSLWSQRGSQVIRGNLLVIPIERSILYIEPIYLQAEASELPELKRVIVAFKDDIVMQPTLDQALQVIFGEAEEPKVAQPGAQLSDDLQQLIQNALDTYNSAQESLRQGNWSQYGDMISDLEEILQKLEETNKEAVSPPEPDTQ